MVISRFRTFSSFVAMPSGELKVCFAIKYVEMAPASSPPVETGWTNVACPRARSSIKHGDKKQWAYRLRAMTAPSHIRVRAPRFPSGIIADDRPRCIESYPHPRASGIAQPCRAARGGWQVRAASSGGVTTTRQRRHARRAARVGRGRQGRSRIGDPHLHDEALPLGVSVIEPAGAGSAKGTSGHVATRSSTRFSPVISTPIHRGRCRRMASSMAVMVIVVILYLLGR